MKWKQKHAIAARLKYVYIKKVTTRKTKSKKNREKAKEANRKRNKTCTQTEALNF